MSKRKVKHTILVLSDGKTYEILNDDIKIYTITDVGLHRIIDGCYPKFLLKGMEVYKIESLEEHITNRQKESN